MSITFRYTGTATAAPSPLNFSTANAATMLAIMGWRNAPDGSASGAALRHAHKRLFRIANSQRSRVPHYEPTLVESRFVSFGVDDDYLQRRTRELLALVAFVEQHRGAIDWW